MYNITNDHNPGGQRIKEKGNACDTLAQVDAGAPDAARIYGEDINMKRILAVLLAVMLLVAAIPAVSVAEEVSSNSCDCDYAKVYRVHTNGGRLYLRTGPGTGYRIITSLSNGKPLKLIRKSGSWYKVRTFGGTTGWVSKKYVKAGAYADVDTASTGLNIRKGPGTCYGIKGSFAHGTRHLLATKVSGNWAYVTKNCKSGWCSMNYLDWCHC